MARVSISITSEQAYAMRDALDLYSRLCIGQLEEIVRLVERGVIPAAQAAGHNRTNATAEQIAQAAEHLGRCKDALGYPRNGSNGIGHPHVDASAHRAYEIQKVLAQALANHSNPNPQFKGVDYDGLGPRYTLDPEPVATITP